MKSLVIRSALFALVAACSGSKRPDNSTPQPAPAAPAETSTQVTDDAATMPAPPTEGTDPADVPHGMTSGPAFDVRSGAVVDDEDARRADLSRVAQGAPDAGIGGRDAGAPTRDAGAGRDAGAVRDGGAGDASAPGGAPIGDAGAPSPSPTPSRPPGPGSAPPPGSPPTPAPPTSPR
jgi:hypothetical protein